MMHDIKICVAGGKGLVGTALVKRLKAKGYSFCATADSRIDLRNYEQTKAFLDKEKPDILVLVAAKHGGIEEYQTKPVMYFNDNLLICSSVITAAFNSGIKKLINIGASCVYGSDSNSIYKEEEYDKQPVQSSTEPYGLAKLAGMKLCEYYNKEYNTSYISLLPVNMYGDGIGYRLDFSSVLPAMIKRFHEAKIYNCPSVSIWGSGENKREFLFVEDFIDAVEMLITKENIPYSLMNVSGSSMVTINELAGIVAKVVGFSGVIENDLTKPNGSSRGRLDSSKIRSLGWKDKIELEDGISRLYKNFCNLMG